MLSIQYILRFSACLILVLIPWDVIWSCGPMLSADETRFSLFRQGLDGNNGMQPFNYSENLFSYCDADPDKLDYNRNCDEWVLFSNNKIERSDVYSVQYMMNPALFLEAKNNGSLNRYKSNSFIGWLLKNENREALNYMELAKLAEETQYKPGPDPWDTSAITLSKQCYQVGIKAMKAIKPGLPVFLQERYTFQAIKMLYYGSETKSEYGQINALYEKNLSHSSSIVAGWSLLYYGMIQVNSNKRTIALLNAFDKTEEKKKFCFQKISQDDLTRLEKSTNNKKLLELINTMKATRSKGKTLPLIQAVYGYNSNSKYLPLLITREINKLENWIWSPEMLYFPYNYRPEYANDINMKASFAEQLKIKDRQYLEEVTSYIESIAGNISANHHFLQLALTHLYNMEHDYTKARKVLREMGELDNPAQQLQRKIEQVITTSQSEDIETEIIKQKLANYINKMILLNHTFKERLDSSHLMYWERYPNYKKDDELSELFILMSHCFEKKKDFVTAGLLYNKANLTVNRYDGWFDEKKEGYRHIAYFDRQATPADLDKLLAFKHKKQKTLFEQLITPIRWGPDDQYNDLKGTILFRQKKYMEALAVFKTVKPDYWDNHYEFNVYLPLTSVTYSDKMFPSKKSIPLTYTHYSKFLIVKDIVNLQDEIAAKRSNNEKAIVYYKLANAFFNTSYYGKAWMVFSYGKSSVELEKWISDNDNWAWFNFYPNCLKYADYYYHCSDAIDNYKRALSLSTNKELGAKCLIALSVCEKLVYKSNAAPSYFHQLKANYTNTNAFKEAAVECPDIRKYIGE